MFDFGFLFLMYGMELFIQIDFQIDFLLKLLELVLQIRNSVFQITDFLHNVLKMRRKKNKSTKLKKLLSKLFFNKIIPFEIGEVQQEKQKGQKEP